MCSSVSSRHHNLEMRANNSLVIVRGHTTCRTGLRIWTQYALTCWTIADDFCSRFFVTRVGRQTTNNQVLADSYNNKKLFNSKHCKHLFNANPPTNPYKSLPSSPTSAIEVHSPSTPTCKTDTQGLQIKCPTLTLRSSSSERASQTWIFRSLAILNEKKQQSRLVFFPNLPDNISTVFGAANRADAAIMSFQGFCATFIRMHRSSWFCRKFRQLRTAASYVPQNHVACL